MWDAQASEIRKYCVFQTGPCVSSAHRGEVPTNECLHEEEKMDWAVEASFQVLKAR